MPTDTNAQSNGTTEAVCVAVAVTVACRLLDIVAPGAGILTEAIVVGAAAAGGKAVSDSLSS